jgi:hypothetical protein
MLFYREARRMIVGAPFDIDWALLRHFPFLN